MKKVITVKGPIEQNEMGLTLPHEHLLVDFAGADKTGKHRYSAQEVIDTMLPYLIEIKELGVKTFVDCTPMYLARDVRILEKLSELSGINILTNTGQYKEPYLPAETFRIEAEELAQQWIDEYESGIDGTGIRPGFIKTAVSPDILTPVQKKVIKAAALTSRVTGLPIATHACTGAAAVQVLDILEKVGADPHKWIFVHAQNEKDQALLLEAARRGVWIELDGIRPGSEEAHMQPLLKLISAGFENQIMLSQDSGWYRVGDDKGGEKSPFTYLLNAFVPLMQDRGIPKSIIEEIMVKNPGKAFSI